MIRREYKLTGLGERNNKKPMKSEVLGIKRGHKFTEIGEIPEEWEVVKLRERADEMSRQHTVDSRQGYKQTELGEIPEEWEVVRLGEVVSLEYGKGLPKKKRVVGKYPVYGSNGIVGYHNEFLVKGPGIIIGRKGTMGAVSWAFSDFWPIDTTYFVKTKRNNIFLKWLYLKLIKLNLKKLSLLDVVPGLNRNAVYSLKVPLPPLPEQQKIAEILSTTDEAIQQISEIIAKTQELKKGLIQELLTKGIGHTRFKKTEIGEIPEEWEVVKLGDERITSLVKSGGTPLKHIKEYYQNGEIPFAKIGDMTKNARFIFDTGVKITKKSLENSSALLVPENSILFSMYGTMGKVLINKVPVAISQNIAAIVPYYNIDVGYLFYSLNQVTSQIYKYLKTITLKHLDINIVKNLKIPLPPLPEQQKIAEILSCVDEKIEVELKKKAELEELKKGLMQDLLTGRVRVISRR